MSTTTYKIKIYNRRGRVGKGTLCRVTCLCKITKASGLKLYHGLNHFTTSIKMGRFTATTTTTTAMRWREQIYAKRVFAKVNFGGTHITMRECCWTVIVFIEIAAAATASAERLMKMFCLIYYEIKKEEVRWRTMVNELVGGKNRLTLIRI